MTYDSEFAVFSRYANVTVRAICEIIFHDEYSSLLFHFLLITCTFIYTGITCFFCVSLRVFDVDTGQVCLSHS